MTWKPAEQALQRAAKPVVRPPRRSQRHLSEMEGNMRPVGKKTTAPYFAGVLKIDRGRFENGESPGRR